MPETDRHPSQVRRARAVARAAARRLWRRGARKRRRVSQRLRPAEVGAGDLAEAFTAAGLGTGDGVFLQASLGRIGHIAGGPDSVLEALERVVGPGAPIVMPAFPFTAGAAEHLSAGPVFDLRRTPSAMGVLSERFRQLPATHRSLHPTHSVCAAGTGASELVQGHERAATPFGAGTPFARMVEREMTQVWLGTDVHAFTIYHAFECLLGDEFPIPVFLAEPMQARCIDGQGRELVVETLVHDPAVARRRVRSRARQDVRRELLARGVMRCVPLGKAELLVARMPPMFEILHLLLRDGLTIYDIDISPPSAT